MTRYPGWLYIDEPLCDSAFEPPGEPVAFLDVRVERVDFSGRRYMHVDTDGTQFIDCDFSRASFRETGFASSLGGLFMRCSFDRADLRDVAPERARFESCTFRNTRTNLWLGHDADFVGCVFSGDRMRGAVFWGPGVGREFEGNDFTGSTLRDVGFHGGVDLGAQRLPTGPEFVRLDRIQKRIARVSRLVEDWSDEERTRARGFLGGLLRPGDAQKEIIIRRDAAYRLVGEEFTERMLGLLEAGL